MLRNLLRFSTFLGNKTLGSTNTRVAQFASNVKIVNQLVPVEWFSIGDDYIEMSSDGEVKVPPDGEPTTFPIGKDYMKDLEEILSTTLIKKDFDMCYRTFTDADVEIMYRHRKSFKDVEVLYFEQMNFALSEESAQMFIKDVCPKAELLWITDGKKGTAKIVNSKVLQNRTWLCIHVDDPSLLLDDEFLLQVVANSYDVEFHIDRSSFTARGVLNMLKKRMSHLPTNIWPLMKLGSVRRDSIELDRIKEIFEKEIPEIIMHVEHYQGWSYCEVSLIAL